MVAKAAVSASQKSDSGIRNSRKYEPTETTRSATRTGSNKGRPGAPAKENPDQTFAIIL